jgi:hypothetical protein
MKGLQILECLLIWIKSVSIMEKEPFVLSRDRSTPWATRPHLKQELTLDGPTGRIFNGNISTIPTGCLLIFWPTNLCGLGTKSDFRTLLRWSDKYRRFLPLPS